MAFIFFCNGHNGRSYNNYKLVTNIFTTNGVFVVPNARNQQFTVRIFGGVGGGGFSDKYANDKAGNGGNGICIIQYWA